MRELVLVRLIGVVGHTLRCIVYGIEPGCTAEGVRAISVYAEVYRTTTLLLGGWTDGVSDGAGQIVVRRAHYGPGMVLTWSSTVLRTRPPGTSLAHGSSYLEPR